MLFDDLARALAGGTSRKDFLKLAGAAVIGLFAADTDLAEAKKGRTACPPGQTACPTSPPGAAGPATEKKGKGGGTGCTNLNSDPKNCGACGKVCPAGQDCGGGACGMPCTDGTRCTEPTVCCPLGCTDVRISTSNCGRCGNACAAGQGCVNGQCTGGGCPSGQKACNGTCQQCCASADCPTGQTCQGGTCRDGGGGATCTTGREGSDLIARVSVPGTLDGQALSLDETTRRAFATGELSTHLVIRLAGNLLYEIDTSGAASGAVQTSVVYGDAFHGIKQSMFTSDGKTVQGSIDGRRILPLPVGSDPNAAHFADGNPPPTVTIDPRILAAIQGLLKQAQQANASCQNTLGSAPPAGASARPGTRAFAGRADPPHPGGTSQSGKCLFCQGACVSAYGLCIWGAAAECAPLLFGAGICIAISLGLCLAAAGGCKLLCDNSKVCCPVDCGKGDSDNGCCQLGETCLDPTAPEGACCFAGLQPCHGRSCCQPTDACVRDGTCCPQGRVICNDTCCNLGEDCKNGVICCPQAVVACNGTCCGVGEDCRQNVCCPTQRTVCSGSCCQSDRPCVQGACCDPPRQICGSTCAAPFSACCDGEACPGADDVCILDASGARRCCDRPRACGRVCCPAGSFCQDAGTGTCGACPVAGQVPCTAQGEPRCCPTRNQCCANGTCCAVGMPCCFDGTKFACSPVSCIR